MITGVGTVAVERKKLYEQIWSTPAARLAVMYGISDVGLAKACKRYNIPRPPRGYWAKVAAGQKMPKAKLPKVSDDYSIVYLKGWDMPDESVQKLVVEARTNTGEVSPRAPATTPLHPLMVTARDQLRIAKSDHEGLVRTDPATAIDLQVSPASVDHCIAIMDALIKRWESKEGTVRLGIAASGGRISTAFAIGTDEFFVQIIEEVDQGKPLTDPLRLTGKLSLHIHGDENRQFRRRWSDTKSQRLEKMIAPLVETLSNAIAVKRADRLDAECVSRQREKIKTRRKKADSVESKEFYWRQELMAVVDRWHDAERIRAYLAALKIANESGRWHPANPDGFDKWFNWAMRLADSIDPIIGTPKDETLPDKPQNVPCAELDLTITTRAVVDRLGVPDADALWSLNEDKVKAACAGKFGPVWNEITRVLEALAYDVAKRKEESEWY